MNSWETRLDINEIMADQIVESVLLELTQFENKVVKKAPTYPYRTVADELKRFVNLTNERGDENQAEILDMLIYIYGRVEVTDMSRILSVDDGLDLLLSTQQLKPLTRLCLQKLQGNKLGERLRNNQ